MPLPNALRTSAFRLTVLYAAVFAASAVALLAFVYASTTTLVDQKTDETIEAEIRGLAEQYRQQGLARLVAVLRERASDASTRDSVYLLTNPAMQPLAGNLTGWPADAVAPSQWIQLMVERREPDGAFALHPVRARTFTLPGGYRLLVGRDIHASAQFRDTMVRAITWSLLGTVVLAVAGGLLLSRRTLTRVDRVSHTAARIMAGDLSQRIGRSGSGDEFDRLADSLNAMLAEIERLMTGMRLATDSIAHDLRSPLTRLKSRIELALRSPPEGEADRRALADALAQTDHAVQLFDRLLAIALAESGTHQGAPVPVDLSRLTADAVDLYQPLAEDRGIDMVAERLDAVTIDGEAQFLAQAIGNLLDNAVKYTPAGGRITVNLRRTAAATVELSVADTGPGIAPDQRETVLERFTRLEESRSTPGAGLGLSLVAAVCRRHGADLRLEDNVPTGLEVVMAFPLSSNSVR